MVPQERRDDVGIELGARLGTQDVQRLLVPAARAIGGVRGQRAKGVGHRLHGALEFDLLSERPRLMELPPLVHPPKLLDGDAPDVAALWLVVQFAKQ